MDLATLTRRLNSAGFDLTDEEARDRLNEAVRDLSASSRFPRKVWEFTTVPGQAEYELPPDFTMPVSVRVDDVPYDMATTLDVARFEKGFLSLMAPGVWFVSSDQRHLGLWRTPSDERSVLVEYVYQPSALVLETDAPVALPEQFHPALIYYVASWYYSEMEDNPDLAAVNYERYQDQVNALKRFAVVRDTGSKPFAVGIRGWTA